MACDTDLKRIVSIAHGATTLANPTGGGYDESVSFGESRPSTRKSPCLWIDTYVCRAMAKFQSLVTPITRGTKASLVYTLQQIGEAANTTVTIINMRMGQSSMDYNTAPYTETYEFIHDAANSEDLAPITVA